MLELESESRQCESSWSDALAAKPIFQVDGRIAAISPQRNVRWMLGCIKEREVGMECCSQVKWEKGKKGEELGASVFDGSRTVHMYQKSCGG